MESLIQYYQHLSTFSSFHKKSNDKLSIHINLFIKESFQL